MWDMRCCGHNESVSWKEYGTGIYVTTTATLKIIKNVWRYW